MTVFSLGFKWFTGFQIEKNEFNYSVEKSKP